MTYCSYCGTTFDRYHECAESGLRITPRRERSPADEAALEAFMDGARAARENAAEIARRLGVSKGCIADVRLRRTWKDIP